MVTRGRAIVTDLQFWKSASDWTRNECFLRTQGAEIVDNINIFNVAEGMPPSVDFRRIGLVVVGGFAPHHRVSAVAQALSHQIPDASLMFLYASRDQPPDYQDTDKVHIQAWTADAARGYVVLAGREGQGGRSRCYSAEGVRREVHSDPALVKLSIFTNAPSSVSYIGTKISPSMYVEYFLASDKDVLFCAEGNATLSSSCLTPSVLTSPLSAVCQLERGRYHKYWKAIDSYQWLLAQCNSSKHVHQGTVAYELQQIQASDGQVQRVRQLERVADIWAASWPVVSLGVASSSGTEESRDDCSTTTGIGDVSTVLSAAGHNDI